MFNQNIFEHRTAVKAKLGGTKIQSPSARIFYQLNDLCFEENFSE